MWCRDRARGCTGGAGSDSLALFENVIGSGFADSLTGSSEGNVLRGGARSDSLFGVGGDDTLKGESGTDTLDGGMNIDTCLGETLANASSNTGTDTWQGRGPDRGPSDCWA
jgi:Ca2+-binding RTX toxin-like protein